MKARIGGQTVELEIEGRIDGGLSGNMPKRRNDGGQNGVDAMPTKNRTHQSAHPSVSINGQAFNSKTHPITLGNLGSIEGWVRQDGRDLTVSRKGCEGITTHRHSAAPSSPYRSKLEARYAQHLDLLKRAGEIMNWWYEPIRFRLPGKRNYYKADFLIQNGCKPLKGSMAGQHAGIEIHEVKGWSKNRREGITKLKTAAGLNTWSTFYLVRWDQDRQQWDKQVVQV